MTLPLNPYEIFERNPYPDEIELETCPNCDRDLEPGETWEDCICNCDPCPYCGGEREIIDCDPFCPECEPYAFEPYYYVGVKGDKREIFESVEFPLIENYGHLYTYIIGPFETMQGAEFMRDYGRNNPHCQCVKDAERLAKLQNQDKAVVDNG